MRVLGKIWMDVVVVWMSVRLMYSLNSYFGWVRKGREEKKKEEVVEANQTCLYQRIGGCR